MIRPPIRQRPILPQPIKAMVLSFIVEWLYSVFHQSLTRPSTKSTVRVAPPGARRWRYRAEGGWRPQRWPPRSPPRCPWRAYRAQYLDPSTEPMPEPAAETAYAAVQSQYEGPAAPSTPAAVSADSAGSLRSGPGVG